MLLNLKISNYALIDNLDIDFTDEFTVISGDTGSGKSIILDAINLILGKRIDKKKLNFVFVGLAYQNNSAIVQGKCESF